MWPTRGGHGFKSRWKQFLDISFNFCYCVSCLFGMKFISRLFHRRTKKSYFGQKWSSIKNRFLSFVFSVCFWNCQTWRPSAEKNEFSLPLFWDNAPSHGEGMNPLSSKTLWYRFRIFLSKKTFIMLLWEYKERTVQSCIYIIDYIQKSP